MAGSSVLLLLFRDATTGGASLMGDKSPKSNKKQAGQKQTKNSATQKTKDDSQSAKQVDKTKK
jgi:hypothetical protein